MAFDFQPSEIRDYCAEKADFSFQKIERLYHLIQNKGTLFENISPAHLQQLKSFEFAPNEYIAIRRIPLSPDSFFPCYLWSYHFTF